MAVSPNSSWQVTGIWANSPLATRRAVLAAVVGGILGGKFALKTKPKSLKTISGLLTIVAAVFMLVNALSVK